MAEGGVVPQYWQLNPSLLKISNRNFLVIGIRSMIVDCRLSTGLQSIGNRSASFPSVLLGLFSEPTTTVLQDIILAFALDATEGVGAASDNQIFVDDLTASVTT
jgi:hypothetical protein